MAERRSMRRAVALVVAFVGAAAAVSCATNSCPQGSQRRDVIPVSQTARSPGFVCLPLDEAAPAAADSGSSGAPAPAPFGEQADAASAPPFDAGSTDGGVALPSACGIGQPGDLEVHFLTRTGLPPAPVGSLPDGGYVLVQATFWVVDGGASPIADARAELAIDGSTLVLTIRSAGANTEAVTMTLAGGLLTTVCRTPTGPATTALFPPTGSTARGAAGWDGSTIDLVIEQPGGSVELAFASPR
jgi:hypothetical protein